MLRSSSRIVSQSLAAIRHSHVSTLPLAAVRRAATITTLAKTITPRVTVTRLLSRHFSTESGALALIEAVQRNDVARIDRIAQHTPRMIAEQTSNDNTALHEAARIGDVAMIEKLSKAFSKHFNVNHRCHCYKRRTPLAYAVEGGHIDAVNKLLSLGADPNITDENSYTALDSAIAGFKKPGANKVTFEKIIDTLLKQHATAKQFPTEAATIIKNSEKQKIEAIQHKFLEEYKVIGKQKIELSLNKFLEERKKLTPGR